MSEIFCVNHSSLSIVISEKYSFGHTLKCPSGPESIQTMNSFSRITGRNTHITYQMVFQFPLSFKQKSCFDNLILHEGIKIRIFYLCIFQCKAKFPIIVVT